MRRILILLTCLLLSSCCEPGNQGYGYNASIGSDQSTSQKSLLDRSVEKRKTYNMTLQGTDGKTHSSCRAYKGEFDGHTWYVFYDNLASPSVVHDPLCKCQK